MYDYKCSACGHAFTLLQSVAERDNARCPRCGGENVRLVMSLFARGVRGTGRGGCNAGGAYGG